MGFDKVHLDKNRFLKHLRQEFLKMGYSDEDIDRALESTDTLDLPEEMVSAPRKPDERCKQALRRMCSDRTRMTFKLND